MLKGRGEVSVGREGRKGVSVKRGRRGVSRKERRAEQSRFQRSKSTHNNKVSRALRHS